MQCLVIAWHWTLKGVAIHGVVTRHDYEARISILSYLSYIYIYAVPLIHEIVVQKGQLGHGDTIQRDRPTVVSELSK